MNVWTALPRLLASSRCLHNVRFLVGERLSSNIRHFPSPDQPPESDEDSTKILEGLLEHLSKKKSLAEADSKVHTQHTAPRLQSTSDAMNFSRHKFLKRARRKKRSKVERKAASWNDTDSTKSKEQKPCEITAEPIPKQGLRDASEQLNQTPPPSQSLEVTCSTFPTENWVSEPWANQQYDGRHTDDIDRSFPPHILEQKIISEGTLNPSVTNGLVDVPTVVEHLPVARLCHGLERVLFKYVIYFWLDFLMIDKSAAPVSIGYETRIRGCITSLRG